MSFIYPPEDENGGGWPVWVDDSLGITSWDEYVRASTSVVLFTGTWHGEDDQ